MRQLSSGLALVLDSYARQSYVKKKARERRGGRNMSIEGQHAVNERRIKEYGATLGMRLQDVGKSAWDPTVRREDWEKLLSRVESKASSGVVIFDIERFLRRVKDAVRIVEMAETGFLVLDSDQEYDLMSPAGRTAFYDAAVAAEGYSHRLSSRVKRGYGLKIQDGEWIGGRWRMFGFETDSTTVREEEAKHIRRVAPQLLSGREPGVIVGELNHLGLTTGSGAPWTLSTFRKYMINPRLAGYIQRHGEIVGRLRGEPILEPTIWQDVVAFYEGRSGRPATGAYLCSGIVVCADCGKTINGEVDNARRPPKYEDGERTRRYISKRDYGGCGKTIADQRVLDAFVEGMALHRLSDPKSLDQIRQRAAREAAARAPIEAEIGRLEGLLAHWDQRLAAGAISLERHEAMTADLDKRLAEQRGKLGKVGDSGAALDAELLNDARAKWEAADGTQRREMLKKAFYGYRILVDPGSTRDEDLTGRIRVEPLG